MSEQEAKREIIRLLRLRAVQRLIIEHQAKLSFYELFYLQMYGYTAPLVLPAKGAP